ncbi:AraC family transcriptional regulator [Chitinophagaceae bacterium IBVUCB2]|nr:AraC family transcriptional regulator [Chitinophagaceae bacterium IBVUCB2]
MNYQVYTPSPELQPFIKCFWKLDDEGVDVPVRQRVVPDGCMEMIFHYGDNYKQYFEDGNSIIQPKCFVFGQITNYLEIEPTGVTGIVAARFNPDGLTPFISMPIAALENKAVEISKVFGEKGIQLEKEVFRATDNSQRIKLIETFLLSFLADPNIFHTITKSCVEAILQSQGQLSVLELADKMNVNRRNLERKFTTAIGMSPKQLSRAVRLQAAIKMLQENSFTNLTSLAYENGYYDQAHFIKDFKEFTGISPRHFFNGNMKFAALFASTD